MFKILIVDDEKLIRMGIKNAMPWESMRIDTVYMAASAREAGEIIREHQPDIMITDISMSEMTGLQLVEQLRTDSCKMRIIVLTGFDRFDYARQALQLQVHDFLLKPIDEDELKASILRQVNELERQQAQQASDQLATRSKGMRRQSRVEMTLQRLLRGEPLAEAEQREFLQENSLDWGCVLRVGILIPELKLTEDDENARFHEWTIKNICMGLIDEQNAGITFSDEQGRILLVFFCTGERNDEEDNAKQLLEILKDELNVSPRLVLGSRASGFGNLQVSYQDALFALEHEQAGLHELLKTNVDRKQEDMFQSVFFEFRQAMVKSIGNSEQMLHVLDRFQTAIKSYNLSGKFARSCCFELASAVYFSYGSDTGSFTTENLYALMQSLNTVDRDQVCDVTARFLLKMFNCEDGEEHELVRKAKHIIHSRLAEDLTVANLAAELYITPNYLSRLFKRVSGEGCNEYIVRKRIEKAKSLLETTTLKTGEIADMVGYHDMNYFSLAFKKHVGVSPTKYRDMVQNQNAEWRLPAQGAKEGTNP
jgi:two-component system response regulator YesN